MFKKLLYLVPVAFIVLNFFSITLFKDTVNFGDTFYHGSPRHWSVKLHNSHFSGTLQEVDPNAPEPKVVPLSQDANFKGFPFGAYFSKSVNETTATSTSSYSVSGWSWLWLTVDAGLVLGSIYLAFKLNRK